MNDYYSLFGIKQLSVKRFYSKFKLTSARLSSPEVFVSIFSVTLDRILLRAFRSPIRREVSPVELEVVLASSSNTLTTSISTSFSEIYKVDIDTIEQLKLILIRLQDEYT